MARSVTHTAVRPALSLRHRALGVRVAAVAGEPRGPPHEQAGGVDLGGHVGEHERDRLVHDDRLAERLALLGVVEGVLVGGAGDADGHGAPTAGRVASKVAMAGCFSPVFWPLAGLGQLVVELLLAAEQAASRARARRRARPRRCATPGCRASCTSGPATGPGVPGGTTKLAWPRPLSSGSTVATTTWTSAMPPLVIHALVPLSTHSSLASS